LRDYRALHLALLFSRTVVCLARGNTDNRLLAARPVAAASLGNGDEAHVARFI
jgi:hypothetical protein